MQAVNELLQHHSIISLAIGRLLWDLRNRRQPEHEISRKISLEPVQKISLGDSHMGIHSPVEASSTSLKYPKNGPPSIH